MARKPDVMQGTLDLLVLRTLTGGPMHGWAIAQRIQQVSGDLLQIVQGSLYPSLHRLEQRGWLQSEWRIAGSNRQAKFYRLTSRGRRQLAEETRNWERLTTAVGRILSNG